jgi:hypothetical protein
MLANETRSNSVEWTETADEGAFRAVFGKGVVEVEKPKQPPPNASVIGAPPEYRALLLSSGGSLIEEFVPQTNPELEALKELYELARESALRPEEVINSIERELQMAVPRLNKN